MSSYGCPRDEFSQIAHVSRGLMAAVQVRAAGDATNVDVIMGVA